MAGASQTSRALARRMRRQLAQLVDDSVQQIREAKLPGYSVFAEPVLRQTTRQLYEALIAGLDTGNAQPLYTRAAEQANRRVRQGVLKKELVQVAEIFAASVQELVQKGEPDDIPSVQAAVEPLLAGFVVAFTTGTAPETPSTEPEATRTVPEAPSAEPEATRIAPEAPGTAPETPGVEIQIIDQPEPEAPGAEPEATGPVPEAPSAEPGATGPEPETPGVEIQIIDQPQPEASSAEPEATETEPEAPSAEPGATEIAPETPSVEIQITDIPEPEAQAQESGPPPAQKPATRPGGKRMTNRHENERDYASILEQLQHQARQLETSAQVSRQLTAALDLDELLLQVVELIKSSFDYYHVHIYLLDIESGELIMREGTGEVGKTLKARGHRIALGRGMVGTVGQSGEPLLTPDVSEIDNWLPNPLLPETKAELTVPLKIGEQILGVLDVQSNEVGGLSETDLSLMEALAQQTAVAVQNALLFRETRAVSIISRAVSSGLGMEQFFAAVSRELRVLVDFDFMMLATYYEIIQQVELVGVDDRTGVDMPLEEGVQLPIDLCIPGMAIQQERSIIAPDLEGDPFSTFIDAEILVKNGMRSMLSVPLRARGQIVATINLVSARERVFTAADAHLMEQISGQLAGALENAQIFENIQQMVAERTSESTVFQAMVENSSEAIALGNVQQILTYANPAFYALHGYDPEIDDLTRRSLTSFIVSEDEGALSDEVRDHILGGGLWREEVQHRRKDGTLFQALTTFFAVLDEAGEPTAIGALIRDVTAERKIMAISQAASSTPELDRLAPLVLAEIAADTDIDRTVLILYDEVTEDGPASMSVVAVHDPERDHMRIVEEHLQAHESPFSTVVYHERAPIWVADVVTDERLFEEGRELLLRHDIVSMLALPIMVRDAVVGMVAIDWRKPVDLTYEQISLYQVMVNQVSTAVENARLIAEQQREMEETLDRRMREVDTSVEVGQAIAAAPELDELFSRVVTLIKERFGYYHAHVYQIGREKDELEMMAGYGEPGRIMRERGHRIPIGKGLTGTAATTGEPVRVDDVSTREDWLPNPLLPDTKSELAVPIKLGDEVLGVLDVQSDRLAGLTEDDELLLLGLCGQIAVSIQNTQILEEVQRSQEAAQRRAHQLELSSGVSEQLSANLNLNELLAAVVSLIQSGFDYYHVHVYLVEEETGDLVMMEGTGEPGRVMKERGHRIPAGKGLVGSAAATGSTVLVPDVTQAEGWLPNPLLPDTKSELSVPFKMGETVIGVLDVQSNEVEGLGIEDQALLEGLGGQIAVAVQNARVFGEIEHQVAEQTREVQVFQALAENAADAIAMADLEGKLFYANGAWYELYHYDPEKELAIGVSVDDVWSPDTCAWMKEAIGRPSSREWRGEVPQTLRDGTRVTIELTAFVVRGQDDNAIAVAALGRDITTSRLSDELTRLVSTASSQSELGVELLRVVLWGMNVDRGSFVIYEGEGTARQRVARTVATYDDREKAVVSVDRSESFGRDPIHDELCKAREAVIYNDLGVLDEERRAPLQEAGIVAIAALPLTTEAGQVSGALLLQRKRDVPFGDEIAFLTPILQQVSLAVSNLIFREARDRATSAMLDQRTAEMQLTTEVAQAISSAPGLDALFQRVVTLVKERFGYYHVHVYQHDPDQGILELAAGYGEPGRIMRERGHSIKVGSGLTGTAAATGEPVLASDVKDWETWLPNPLLPDTQSEVAVPIKMGNEVLGVLDVQDDQVGALNQDTQVLLQGLCGQIAIAIQNTRLLQETQASLRRTDLLLNLSTALSSLTEPQAIADALAEQLMNISNIERCSVTLCSEYDAQDMPHLAQVYALSDRDPKGRDAAIGHSYALTAFPTLLDVVITQRRELVVPDLRRDESLSDGERTFLQQGGAVSTIVVPMVSGERVVGYFVLQDRQSYTFTESELELYRGIASQSATAFSNALSLYEVQETLDEVNMLYESSRAISTANTREALSETIIQRIVSTNVDHCEILFYEQRDLGARFVEVVGSWSLDGDAPDPGTRYRLSEYALTEAAKGLATEGTFVVGAGDAEQPDQVRQWCVSRGIKALALVPLSVGEEHLGFLVIERHKSSVFAPDTVRFYETVASQSAVALRNIQLIEQTQRQLDQLQKSYDDVARLADTVRELSSPVIQVWEDVLVLPLVGAIDSRRAMNMMESLLTGITEYQAEQVIIDITGVPVVDTSVANYLLQTIKAASLLGARCMVVGINSEMAQTIVGLGLDLSSITTYSNLRAGIQAALESTGFAITSLGKGDGEVVL